MSNAEKLTLAFLEQAPAAAAGVLQALPVEQASAYLRAVPARLAGPALSAMTPWHAARVVESLAPSRAALLLRQLSFVDTAGISRMIPAESREQILAELPTIYARRLSRSLQYPLYQVGAWIDPGVPILSRDGSIGDALNVLRAAENATHVFLEDAEHGTYVGAIPVQQVLRAEPTAHLSHIRETSIKPVSSRASLSAVLTDTRWDAMLHLPVVDRRGHLLGGLSRAGLREGIHDHRAQQQSQSRSLLTHMIGALMLTWTGVARLSIGHVAPLSRPAGGKE